MVFLPRLKPQVVVAALATLVLLGYGLTVAFMLNLERGGRRGRMARDMRNILMAVTQHEEHTGRALSPSEGFSVLVEERLLERIPVDPWGHDYKYRVEAGTPVILSYGRDGIPDGDGPDADLSSRVLLAE